MGKMIKTIIGALSAVLILQTVAFAVSDSAYYNGLVSFSGVDSQIFKDRGANIYSWELGPDTTIVSEEFEIPSWTKNGTASLCTINHSGSRSLNMNHGVYDGTYSGMSQAIKVNQGRRYRIEFYVKADRAWGNTVVAGGVKRFLPTGTYDWRKLGFTVTAPAGIMNLDFRSYNHTENVWVDDITVIEDGSEYSVINNGGFEQEFPENGFLVNEGAMNYVRSVFAHDEKVGIKAMLLLSPHYTPDWFWEKYPSAVMHQEGFLKGNVADSNYRELIRTHARAMAEAASEFSSLHSIVLTNEPIYHSGYNTSVKGQIFYTAFIDYLRGIYGAPGEETTEKFRNNWDDGSLYTWGQVSMPSSNNITAGGRFWDFMEFNNKTFGDFHKLMADTVHSVSTEIPVHAKLMLPVFNRTALRYGTDFEELNGYFDYNGFDGGAFYDSSRESYLTIRMAEDLFTSVSGKKSVNSENHLVEDGCTDYSDKHKKLAAADVWQGFIHGRSVSSVWVWAQDPNDPVFGNSVTYRQDVLSSMSAALGDANRLSDEIAQLSDADTKFYILYSRAALLYNDSAYLSACYNAYEALWSLGQKPGFITENKIASGIPDGAVLIIPSARNIDEVAAANLSEYGGKIVVIGQAPSKNEYNAALSVPLKNSVTVSDSLTEIIGALSAECSDIITLKDSRGNYLSMTDIRAVETENGILINACNNTWSTKYGISVYKNGEKLTGFTNLRNGASVSDGFALRAFDPILLYKENAE